MTAYSGGRTFEWKCRDHLRNEGYEVIRSAGSKSKVDLVALRAGQLLLVQCKRDGVCSPAEWDRVHELATWVGAIPVLAVNGPKGRGVVLWRLLGPKRRRLDWAHQPVTRFHTDELDPA
jgi:Holliday junction resolvase